MHALLILAILIVQNIHLVNMRMLSVMIMTPVLTILAALYRDVFTMIIATNVLLLINVMTLNATNNKDVLSQILLTVALILTNVIHLLVMMM
jgi:hypothetical protein